ncbi:MAG: hypothetical protein H7039_10455, partial [Bryobacteraceae bacterium]|nr:hypothetical protein [Bryobacteraceae bacterium]
MCQTTAAVRDGAITISRRIWPVVVVPGIMGSRLKQRTSDQKIWDPDHLRFNIGLMMESPDDLARRFSPETTRGEPMTQPHYSSISDPAHIARGWGGPAWDFYGRGIEDLQRWLLSEGGLVYGFGYDWREDNAISGRKLLDFIYDRVRPSIRYKPIVVTHSNGGLVTRAACRLTHSSGMTGQEMIGAVIHTFMPTYGSPEAYVKIKTGEPTVALRQIVGANAQEIAVIASGVTVMFQLMPNQLYPSIRVDGESGANWLTCDPRLERDSEPAGPYSLNDPYSI